MAKWATKPETAFTDGDVTTVYVELRSGRQSQGLALPYTFPEPIAGVRIANRRPDDVVFNPPQLGADNRRWFGVWRVVRLRWQPQPLSVVRLDYETVMATFEPATTNTPLLAAVEEAPHTFTVAGVTVTDRKPDRVVPVRNVRFRGAVVCPCLGMWVVRAPLAEPGWSEAPYRAARRSREDRNVVLIEYEFFFPPGSTADWAATARRTPRGFTLGRRDVPPAPPAEVIRIGPNNRIVGRWSVVDPFVEGYSPEPCDDDARATSSFVWWLVAAVLLTMVVTAGCCRRT